MKHAMLSGKMAKTALLLALAATFAGACATTTEHSSPSPVSWAGPSGPAGVAGEQGAKGYTGARDASELAGVSGSMGSTGAAGPQGAIGQTGAQGPMAANGSWSVYRNYTFNSNSDRILNSDAGKAGEVADYAKHNPSYRVGVDGLNDKRVSNVRDALIEAGVPASRIETGTFGDPQQRDDRTVAVLVAN